MRGPAHPADSALAAQCMTTVAGKARGSSQPEGKYPTDAAECTGSAGAGYSDWLRNSTEGRQSAKSSADDCW
jgi:hypothetical protein